VLRKDKERTGKGEFLTADSADYADVGCGPQNKRDKKALLTTDSHRFTRIGRDFLLTAENAKSAERAFENTRIEDGRWMMAGNRRPGLKDREDVLLGRQESRKSGYGENGGAKGPNFDCWFAEIMAGSIFVSQAMIYHGK